MKVNHKKVSDKEFDKLFPIGEKSDTPILKMHPTKKNIMLCTYDRVHYEEINIGSLEELEKRLDNKVLDLGKARPFQKRLSSKNEYL